MRNSTFFLGAFLLLTFFSSCVSSKKHQELEMLKNHYQDEAERLREVQEVKNQLESKLRTNDVQLRQTTQDLEQSTVLADRLKRDNADLLGRYNKLLEQNKNVLSSTSLEKQTLEEELATKIDELDKKKRELEGMEYILGQRETNLDDLKNDLNAREQRVNELESMLNAKEEQMAALKKSIQDALLGFSATDLTVTEQNGRIYVSLSQNLLFKSGSDDIDWKGKNAIKQLAEVLNENTEIDITVEGHTDSKGNPKLNWDLSVKRATAVVDILTTNGVDPTRIIASGRGLYAPVLPNDTEANRAKNRRTEIILSPKLDQLYEILK